MSLGYLALEVVFWIIYASTSISKQYWFSGVTNQDEIHIQLSKITSAMPEYSFLLSDIL